MAPSTSPKSRYLISCLCFLSAVGVGALSHHEKDPDLFHFRSRPDLKAPKWDVTVYDEEKLTDGCWFVGVKPSLEKTIGTGQVWFGPTIYDGKGELVWSGTDQFDTSNVMDFRMSNVLGEDRLTVLDRDRQIGIVLDNHYEILETFDVSSGDGKVNAHELNWVDDGKSVLVIENDKEDAPEDEADEVGYTGDEPCAANYMAFKEYDATNGYEPTFDWRALGHIRLNESTETDGKVNDRCNTWDFIHANSLDKTPDGDYLYSGRHTSTIYKVSHKDGSIMWRLGGLQSDFDMGGKLGLAFSRQHNIRSRGQNETHEFVSFLDNAKGQDSKEPTHDFSRGLLLALSRDVTPMTVSVVQHYDHPYKDRDHGMYANRRGNMQVLDNDNVWMGWSEQALQSEHSPDGTLLMEAVFKADWLGSYRNYKFPFVGKPLTKPDVYAVSYFETEEHEHLPKTEVAVSWNGDTEVKTWNLHGIAEDAEGEGKRETLMASSNRTGFETRFDYEGYLKSVRLEGLDKNGETIADSGEIKTVQHPSPPPDHDFQDSEEGFNHEEPKNDHPFLGNPNVTFALLFILGLVLSAFAVLLGWLGYLPLRWLTDSTHRLGIGKLRDAVQYKKVAVDEEDQDHELGQPLTNGNGKIRLHSPIEPP